MRNIEVLEVTSTGGATVRYDGNLTATEEITAHWIIRDRQKPDWVEHYWKSRLDPQRAGTMACLERVAPFTSLVEIGCNCGPNLALIAERWSHVVLTGVDVNEGATAWARTHVPTATIITADLMEWLPDQAENAYDVLLSQRTLEYIHPSDIRWALGHCWRISRNMVIREPQGPTALSNTEFVGWRHPYDELLAEIAA